MRKKWQIVVLLHCEVDKDSLEREFSQTTRPLLHCGCFDANITYSLTVFDAGGGHGE